MSTRKWYGLAGVAAIALVGILAAGCGQQQAAGQASAAAKVTLPTAHLAMDVLPGFKLGPDGKLHDAFSPSTLTVAPGQKVELTVYNYDNMPHSFTSMALGVDQAFAPSPKNGQASVTVIDFTAPKKAGSYTFECIKPCDTPNGGWSMSQQGYMIGTLVVQ